VFVIFLFFFFLDLSSYFSCVDGKNVRSGRFACAGGGYAPVDGFGDEAFQFVEFGYDAPRFHYAIEFFL